MTISAATRTLATGVAAAALLVTAVLATSPARAGGGDRGSGAMTGAPTVGTCSTMTLAQGDLNSDTSTVVPCHKPHTALVAGVVKLPASMDWSAKKGQVFDVVARRCLPQVWQRIGGTAAARDMTAYSSFWFEPTKADKAQGARWLSCSIYLAGGTRLVDLPTNRTPLLPRKVRRGDEIARCLTGSIVDTTCDRHHQWRATGTFTLHLTTRPAARSLNKTATRRCLPFVDRQKFYRFTYKDPATWAAGDHTVVCYTRTSA